jgi:DNA-binding LacI/PurR family transcriptional regulator
MSEGRARVVSRPTLASVAEAVGVSAATVSNVYNRPHRVSEELRLRVLAEAAVVGYTGPHPTARHLRRGHVDALGLLFTDEMPFAFEDQASVGFLAGLAQECSSSGLSLVLIAAGPPRDAAPVAAVTSAAVDGIIVYSVSDHDPNLRSAQQRGLPLVVVDQPRRAAGADWVGIDDRRAALEIGRHVVSLGHRSIGVITSRLGSGRRNGPVNPSEREQAHYAVQRERLRGIGDALDEAGMTRDALTVEERFDASAASGAAALNALLDRRGDLTAVCCLADVLALGALEAARLRGLAVPRRLSITGFDDIPEAARQGLTTVHQPLREKGRVAGDLLLRQLRTPPTEKPARRRRTTLPTTLQIRNTTGPAPVPPQLKPSRRQ